MKTPLLVRIALTFAAIGLVSIDAADAKKAPAQPRGPITAEERAAHLPPLPPADQPLASADTTFEEMDGLVVVEAEHFVKQTRDQIRRWYLNSAKHSPTAKPDPDPVNVADAGGGAYIEVLPDTFVLKHERAIDGINIGLSPGSIAVVHYPIHFSKPGRYYLWSRIRSNDDEDNTMNGGLNDDWPASGKCLQFPKLKKEWWWGAIVRSPKGPGFPSSPSYLDVPTAGVHTVMFSMREDGMEFDRFLLTTDAAFKLEPRAPGPAASAFKTGKLTEKAP